MRSVRRSWATSQEKCSDKLQSEIDGARAEYAVSKLYGLDRPTLNILGDGGKDLWFGDLSVDVKFTKTDDLIFDDVDAFKADVAVLGNHGDDPRSLMVVGCVSRGEFASRATPQKRKYGMKLCMGAEDVSAGGSMASRQIQAGERWTGELTKRHQSCGHSSTLSGR